MENKKIVLFAVALAAANGVWAQSKKSTEINDSAIHDSIKLKEVTVVAARPVVKMETDKMTYNVQQDTEAKAATVLDILRKVPMVTVDGQDNITVNGSSDFKVYVDNKPNPMFSANASQIFKAMPASMVKNIEVITNPGAKYDAEGTGGILNITLMKTNQANNTTNGYNGNVSLMASNRGSKGSAFISGSQGKLTYSANALYAYQRMNGSDIMLSRAEADGSNMAYQQHSNLKQPFAMGNISLGYEIDSLSNLNVSAGLTDFCQRTEGNPVTRMWGGRYGQGFSYGNWMKQKESHRSFNGSIDYQRFFNSERSSYMILSYLFNSNPSQTDNRIMYDNAEDISQITLANMLSKNKANGTEHTLQADFTEALSPHHKLNFGGKYVMHIDKADAQYYSLAADGETTLVPANSMNYKNTQNIAAGYAEWKGSMGKTSATAGMRYEHTWLSVDYHEGQGTDFNRNYGTLVPNASVSWTVNPSFNVGINYNMRIMRPGITYLNPYINRSDPTKLVYGNADLDVEKTHNVSMVLNYFSMRFMMNATLSQSFCNNKVEQYSFIDGHNLLNQTYGNVANNRTTKLNLFVNWLLFAKTRLVMTHELDYSNFSSDRLHTKNYGWHYSGYMGLQQQLPWQLEWSLGCIAQTRSYTLQGDNSGMSFVYSTLSKALLKDKLNLSLIFITPFSDKLDIKNRVYGTDYVQYMHVKVPIRQLNVTLTWKFGNTKKQFAQHKSNISNDFQNQQSQGQSISNMGTGSVQ